MIDGEMVIVCVLARVQAEGKEVKDYSQEELGVLTAEAIADLRLADELANANHQA